MPRQKQTENELLKKLDRLPERERLFQKAEKSMAAVAEFYGFEKIHTPSLEDGRFLVPLAGVGVWKGKVLASCRTKSGEEILLRPSGALSVVRAYGLHKMNDWPHPVKLFFAGDSFLISSKSEYKIFARSEIGLVMIGEEGPVAEAEIVQVIWKALDKLGVKMDKVELRLNSTGCADCKGSFRSAFASYFRSRAGRLCKNCKRNFKRVPTKILSCEDEKCRVVSANSPQVLDFLCEGCKKHLKGFLEFMDEVKIPYFLDARLFRDDSWFNALIFEFAAEVGERAEDGSVRKFTFVEGGRMSRSAGLAAGKKLDVVSGSILFEELETLLGRTGGGQDSSAPKIFLTHLGELAKRRGLSLLEDLRAAGVEARESLGRDSIKSQLKIAEKMGAVIALILGQKEALDNTIIVREIQSGIQETVPQDKLIEFLKKKLKK